MPFKLRQIPLTICLLLALASFSFAYNATGGTITYDGNYTVHTFLTNSSLIVSGTITNATILTIAGGGGAGGGSGGGGGAGGVQYNLSQTLTGNIAVVVGAGGNADHVNRGTDGEPSTFGTITTVGGGGGGSNQGGTNNDGKAGGSGGGGRFEYASTAHTGGAGTLDQGRGGGNATYAGGGWVSGGGGGAGAMGGNSKNADEAGDGGAGINYSINGSTVCYAGGGGGGCTGDVGGRLGGYATCGGGDGKSYSVGIDGTNGTGGGGGGGGFAAGSGSLKSGNGGSGIVIVRYLTYIEPITTNNIVWISQTPANLTTLNIVPNKLNISYNITNITSGTPYLSYKVNNSISDVGNYINGTAYSGWNTATGTNVSSIFNFTLDDNQVLPGRYALTGFNNIAHSALSLSSNSYLSTQIFNISNYTPYNFYEFMANGTGTNSIAAYYCNSSYAFGNAPGANANCALIGNTPNNNPYNHVHTVNSSHQLLPFSINTASGTFGSTAVKITSESYFILRGTVSAGTNYYYINATTRPTTTKLSTNSGNSYTNQTYTADNHLHQYTTDQTIYYQAFANVSGALNYSNIFSQIYGLTNLPPTSPALLTPTAGLKYGSINITWLASQNLTPGTITYNVSLLNPDFTFNKTLNGSTALTYFVWDSQGTPQGNYTIMVNATSNQSLSAYDIGEEFTVATFNITHTLPNDGVVLQGNTTLITYSVNNLMIGATCSIMLDAVAYDSRTVNNAAVSYLANVSAGSHTIYITCTSADTLYTATSAARVFSMGFVSYAYIANLTSTPANVYATPQAIFYDNNGSLNVLYYTNEPAGNTLWIKTIYLNNTIATYSTLREKTNSFYSVFRDTNGTLILSFNDTNGAVKLFKPEPNGTITTVAATFPYTNVMNNTAYDAYTYANTAHYETLNLTANSFFYFMVPLTNGTGKFKKMNNATAITQVGEQLPGITATWQTIANNSQLTGWYYLNSTGTDIQLAYYNGSINTLIRVLDTGYTGTQLNGSIGNFYEYGGEKYVMLSNLTNTTIYDINDNITWQTTETIANPSFLFFVDKDTFLFFNTVGATTNAYSCYFKTAGNCTKFSAAEYGLSMPYERGAMSTAKRSGNSDVVAKGVISSGDVVKLLYNQYTYDGKYVCYDEMAETRLTFKVGVYTDTTANVLNNASWGYVIPSSILGIGTKKAYFLCENGTQRLFIAGLNANYTINSYSLQQPKGVYYTFQALDQYSIPISNATITAYRFSVANQQFVAIEQGITDFNGNAVFYLEPYQFYKFVVSANGYVVLTFDLTPGADTVLEFKLTQAGGTVLAIPTFNRVFNDVSYTLSPASTFQNDTFNITYSISSANATLEYYCMNITREYNGTSAVVYNATGTTAGGGILQYTATQNGTYRVSTCFKAQNYTLYEPPKVNYFLSVKQGLSYVKDRLPGMMGGWAYFLIATVISLLVAGYISRYTIDGAGIMGLMVLWFFTVMNPGAVIMGAANCTLGSLGCITIVMATALTSIIVMAGLIWKQFG